MLNAGTTHAAHYTKPRGVTVITVRNFKSRHAARSIVDCRRCRCRCRCCRHLQPSRTFVAQPCLHVILFRSLDSFRHRSSYPPGRFSFYHHSSICIYSTTSQPCISNNRRLAAAGRLYPPIFSAAFAAPTISVQFIASEVVTIHAKSHHTTTTSLTTSSESACCTHKKPKTSHLPRCTSSTLLRKLYCTQLGSRIGL
jgi:hypothetical protein